METNRMSRRSLLKRGTALAAAATVPTGVLARAAGAARRSGTIRIGFIALTDAASVIMAEELKFFDKRGLDVQVIKQASWPATRDAIMNGDIDMCHGLLSLPLSVQAGIGGTPSASSKIKVAMILNQNGQAITMKKDWAAAGYGNLAKAKSVMGGGDGQTYAMTFPGGTHDTWLRYWLMAMKIPMSVPKIIPIPPPQMVANMKVNTMDAFCVGEPWGGVAAQQGVGFTNIATQDIWEFHPEKALLVNADFAASRKTDLMNVMDAILEASRVLDFPKYRARTAQVIGQAQYVNADPSVIQDRLNGVYDLGAGLGTKVFKGDQMRFHRAGKVNFPRRSYMYWFLAQYQRFGLLKSAPDYKGLTNDILLQDVYKAVARKRKIAIPNDDMAPIYVKLDKTTFDPKNPAKEAARA